ncbi:MAG: mercury resistance system periplasmic binding protein MerP [Rhizobiaceae bacterium]|nr:mercury resistance system periplasmic binding protein MerP [Rhizobiaceae bacterium]
MRKILTATLLASALFSSTMAMAAEQTIKLAVPGMTCASCPFIVKEAISRVEGIKSVEATMDDRSATVIFDDQITNLEEITQATANVGYPSTLFVEANDS